jgi:hypothetical protein
VLADTFAEVGVVDAPDERAESNMGGDFLVGAKVEHFAWGLGVVTKVQDAEVFVQFEAFPSEEGTRLRSHTTALRRLEEEEKEEEEEEQPT